MSSKQSAESFFKSLTQEEKNILEKLRKKSRSKKIGTKKLCYTVDCKNNRIGTHLLQKKGPLSDIAEDGHIYQPEVTGFFDNKRAYKINQRGIDDDYGGFIKYWGFCNSCDSAIFSAIEPQDKHPDYSIYKNQVLTAFRGYMGEYYKIECNHYWFRSIEVSELRQEIKDFYSELLSDSLRLQPERDFYKEIFEGEINSGFTNSRFSFHHTEVKKIDVISSGMFSIGYYYNSQQQIPHNYIYYITPNHRQGIISRYYFINLLPASGKLHSIVGWPNLEPTTNLENDLKNDGFTLPSDWDFSSPISIQKNISDVLIKYMESWGVSPKGYRLLDEKVKVDKVEDLINYMCFPKNKLEPISLNLFEILGEN